MKMFYGDGKQVAISEERVEKCHEVYSDNFSSTEVMNMLSCKTNAAV